MYHESDASFSDLPESPAGFSFGPPDNCLPCLLTSQHSDELSCLGNNAGISYLGTTYHKDDYALFKSQDKSSPAHIGKIEKIQLPTATRSSIKSTQETIITFQLLGRMTDGVKGTTDMFLDEVSYPHFYVLDGLLTAPSIAGTIYDSRADEGHS